MQEEYVAPQLKLVGKTDEVVLGLGAVGPDIWNEWWVQDIEFLED